MKQKESSDIDNQMGSDKAEKSKSTAIIDAGLIGMMIGIVIYSAVNNSIGFFTLIPLYLAYKILHKSKNE